MGSTTTGKRGEAIMDDFHRRLFSPTDAELAETIALAESLSDEAKRQSKTPLKEINKAVRVVIKDDWHAALESVLRARGKVNTILTEFELGVDPDRIDFLILIMDPGIDFDGPAFRHFKKHNVLEYKGGTDKITETVVRKTCAYGNEYCTLSKSDSVNASVSKDITLNILFESMEQYEFDAELIKTNVEGVYILEGYTDLPLYVIVLSELDGVDYAAYRSISARPKEEDFKAVLREYKEKGTDVGALVTLVANKDPELFDQVRKELEYMTALKDIMKDEWEEIIRDERADEKEQTAKENAQRLIKRGKMTLKEIAEDTGLSLSEVEELAGVAMA